MASDFELDCDIRVSTLSKYPDVFVMEEQDIDEEELWTPTPLPDPQASRGASAKADTPAGPWAPGSSGWQ